MKISYSILVHNEDKTLEKLLKFLVKWKHVDDEIVILDDYSDNEKTKQILDFYVSTYDIVYEQRNLLKDFASQKNYLKSMCNGDYSFNLDADEMISRWMIQNVHTIIDGNPTIDLFWVPRINTVDGITEQHCMMYGYKLNEEGWINFPDWQGRIFKNRPNIRWEKPVHEMLVGFKEYTTLPAEKEYSFIHHKDIKKQEKQNQFYGQI